MTRKHFVALAAALLRSKPEADSIDYQSEFFIWQRTVKEIAAVCRTQNPSFDQDRFYEASGLR